MGGGIYMYSTELKLHKTTFERCKGRAGAAALDAFNCILNSDDTLFIACEAPHSYTGVILKEANISAEAQIGPFEQCRVTNSIIH